jgi:cytochrome b involved in lipid metabolism
VQHCLELTLHNMTIAAYRCALLQADDAAWRTMWHRRFAELWSTPAVAAAAHRWHCHHFDPAVDTPPQGWKCFYLQFEQCWLDWAAAGCNTEGCCVLGVDSRLYDVSTFVENHPGGTDTLLDNAGKDASEVRHAHCALHALTSHFRAVPVCNI